MLCLERCLHSQKHQMMGPEKHRNSKTQQQPRNHEAKSFLRYFLQRRRLCLVRREKIRLESDWGYTHHTVQRNNKYRSTCLCLFSVCSVLSSVLRDKFSIERYDTTYSSHHPKEEASAPLSHLWRCRTSTSSTHSDHLVQHP